MRVSVVVPVYNARTTIPLCVDALLRQDLPPDAIYLVDNGSTDGTYEWLQARARDHPLIHVIREVRRGPSAARNAAICSIEEGIVAFTDADVIPEPQWLANHAAAYARPDVVAVAGSVAGYQPRALIDRYRSIIAFSLPNREMAVRKCAPFVGFPTANLSVRADVIRRLGGFDESMRTGEDHDLCCRMLKSEGTIMYVPQARVLHIFHSTIPAMIKRSFEYGMARPKLVRKHFQGMACALIGRHVVTLRGPFTVCINLTTPEKVSLTLLLLSWRSTWFLALLGLYWLRLAFQLSQAARGRGVVIRTGGELAVLAGLHLINFCANGAGSLIASPRSRVVCV